MKTLVAAIILILAISSNAELEPYKATVSDLDGDINLALFDIIADKKVLSDNLHLDVKVIDKNSVLAIQETAIVNKNNAEVIEYKINNKQTRESGVVTVKDNIKIEYTNPDNKTTVKEISKPARLVAPANFELWIIRNFEALKKEKSMVIDFLIWDRLETIKFKVTYLGEKDLEGQKTQLFKMNIDNFLIATFISPIKLWYKSDMSEIVRYEGRVAVRKKTASGYEDLNGRVIYKYQ